MSGLTFWTVEKVITPIENGLLAVGINSAFKAGVAAGVLTAGALWYFKPVTLFDGASGKPRPWALLDGHEEAGVEPTLVPWYMTSALVGYGVNLII